MASKKNLGVGDDLTVIVIIGAAAFVGYYAITGTAKGKICGSKNAAEVTLAKTNIAGLIASVLKTKASPPLTAPLTNVRAAVLKYDSALNDMVQKNLCQYDIDFTRSPPAFWKAFANYTLIIAAQHSITLRATAITALNQMKQTGNGNLLNSAYTRVQSYAATDPSITSEGFRFADAIINVFDQTYKLKPIEQGGPEDYNVSNVENPVTVDG